jgi:hypothetical protein
MWKSKRKAPKSDIDESQDDDDQQVKRKERIFSPEQLAAFTIFAPGIGPVGHIPLEKTKLNATPAPELLKDAVQKTAIWLLNYFLIMQITELVQQSQPKRKNEALLVILGLLTFSFSVIETKNGRLALLITLIMLNFIIYFNGKNKKS